MVNRISIWDLSVVKTHCIAYVLAVYNFLSCCLREHISHTCRIIQGRFLGQPTSRVHQLSCSITFNLISYMFAEKAVYLFNNGST